ncbi:Beta protein [Gracilibacillus orientalis]|uniref:Beta protein n=1 Tax=Gracilibacillus orientalis TaxID=334253 RepID=A0A1I4PLC4_9BACI|nr:hypothetical protein [Gracilibacillus orientalis]SFM28557.1 Beta protein [Gracilibacillus orientalis]
MYVPIMKNLAQEIKVTKDLNQHFGESIMPLFELITEKYNDRFKIDPKTGDPVKTLKPGNKIKTKVKLPNKPEDIKTLDEIVTNLQGKRAFIDFFRHQPNEYKNVKVSDVQLSFSLSRDYSYYRDRMLEIKDYENLIPTISIKDGFKMSITDLNSFITELKKNNSCIALRITDNYLEDYIEEIAKLSHHDFIMLDIREQNAEAKFIELQEFQEIETNAKKILLNSPRPRKKYNSEFNNLEFTRIIDNIVATEYRQYKLNGFGDFGGLKDRLPSPGGGNNGSALALIFLKDKNKFFSIVNEDKTLGVTGYPYVVQEVLNNVSLLDKTNTCPIIKAIRDNAKKGSFGGWPSWIYYTLARYIHQQATK